MRRVDYYVFKDVTRWKVRYRDTYIHFPDEHSAMAGAVWTAHGAGVRGDEPRVLTQAGAGLWKVAWAYGDPYPPHGLFAEIAERQKRD